MWGNQQHPQSPYSSTQGQPTGTQPPYNPYSTYSYNGHATPSSAQTTTGQAPQTFGGRQHVYDQRPGHGGGVYGFPQRESHDRVHHQYETHRMPAGVSSQNSPSPVTAAAASPTPQKTYPSSTQPSQHHHAHQQPQHQPHPPQPQQQQQPPLQQQQQPQPQQQQPQQHTQHQATSPAPTTTQPETDDRNGALSPVPKISMITRIVNDIDPIRVKYESMAYNQLSDNEKDNAEITKHRKAYTELLTQKVVGLDGVEAEGLESVRQARKEAVVKVEALLSQLDTFVKRETELREIMKTGPV